MAGTVSTEMKLLSVENYDAEPALEGKSLTLVCTARGSPRLQFRWYKDHYLFNASLTARSAWEVRLQDDFDDKQMFIFNVDGVTMFDKGELGVSRRSTRWGRGCLMERERERERQRERKRETEGEKEREIDRGRERGRLLVA